MKQQQERRRPITLCEASGMAFAAIFGIGVWCLVFWCLLGGAQ